VVFNYAIKWPIALFTIIIFTLQLIKAILLFTRPSATRLSKDLCATESIKSSYRLSNMRQSALKEYLKCKTFKRIAIAELNA
jgi:hypothetical protein